MDDGYFNHMKAVHDFQELNYSELTVPRLSISKEDMELLNIWYTIIESLMQNDKSA